MAPTTSTLFGVASVLVSTWGVHAEEAVCSDATPESNPECYRNIVWAKEQGTEGHADWYKNFPDLTKDSSLAEFQFALALPGDAKGWNCTMPCSISEEWKNKFATTVLKEHEAIGDAASKQVADFEKFGASVATDAEESGEGTTTAGPGEKGWTWVNYVLIALGICCVLPCLGLCCSAFLCYESVAWIFGSSDKPEKKKKARGVKVVQAPEVPAVAAPVPMMQAPAPTASSFIAVARPVTAAPITYTTAPVVHHVAAPVTYTTAAPVQYVSPQVVHQVAPVRVEAGASVTAFAPTTLA
eukprot:TRINITY_DN1877_c0_g1_i1.p1 TRINITY_DN1877_c0_g1~~TRINITY_DN1877_c0_g1_i1.p1  ORF type:complete len:324 (-),score=65.72 TRINITY_DN1877_c0_g1_i1:139-1032(-)